MRGLGGGGLVTPRWYGGSDVKTDVSTQAPRKCASETFWGEHSKPRTWSETSMEGLLAGGFMWMGVTGMRVPTCGPGIVWVAHRLPRLPKDEAPGLAQVSGRRGGGDSLRAVQSQPSKIDASL